MLKYKFDVLHQLKSIGYNTNKLRQDKLLAQATIQNIRQNKIVGINSLHVLCKLFNCQLSDIIEYIPDEDNVTE